MSCHEIAALRLGLMRILGRPDEAERQHELAELGGAAEAPGPLRSLCNGTDLEGLARGFAAAAADLEAKAASADPADPNLPYLRTLVVLTRKVELDLARQIEGLAGFYRDLEVIHDLVHETYPGG